MADLVNKTTKNKTPLFLDLLENGIQRKIISLNKKDSKLIDYKPIEILKKDLMKT